jgi:hypothetical protein
MGHLIITELIGNALRILAFPVPARMELGDRD